MRRSKVPVGMFGSEAELCESLVVSARAASCKVHAECGTWDLVIECRETGRQIGVQGKLRPSVSVLAQAITPIIGPGPEIHAVLVPYPTADFRKVASQLRLHVFCASTVEPQSIRAAFERAPRWEHRLREWTPDIEVITPAGTSSPRKVTPWKISAVKLCLRARERGYVTRAELRELDLDLRWWLARRFGAVLEQRVVGDKRCRGEYVLRDPSSPLVPDLRWPEIVDALRVEQQQLQPTLKGPRLRVRREPQPKRSTILPPAPAQNDTYDEDRIASSSK